MTYLEYADAHRKKLCVRDDIDIPSKYCPRNMFSVCKGEICILERNSHFTNKEKRETCIACWNREMPDTSNADKTDIKPHILDSGNRRKFESGAVRDICEGKGRCDLLPLNVLGRMDDPVLTQIDIFQSCGLVSYLYAALEMTYGDSLKIFPDKYTMLLEVSKHFEEGAKKYGDNNWRKGIPIHCYIDSAVRHYLKYRRGDKDEPHDRAFCWNLMCGIWTCLNKPELNEYRKDVSVDETA